MTFKYTALFGRNFILMFALGFFIFGISQAIAKIEIIAPTWGGKSLNHIVLDGSDSRQQLLVNYNQADGFLFDKTRSVQLFADPQGLISITNLVLSVIRDRIFSGSNFKSFSLVKS